MDFAICFLVLLGMMAFYEVPFTWRVATLPAFILLALVTALGGGLWLAAFNVRYRDVKYITPFLTQFWLYATPVAYSSSLVPEQWRALYGLNPMAGVVDGFRWAMLGQSFELGGMFWDLAGCGVAAARQRIHLLPAHGTDVRGPGVSMGDYVITAEGLGKKYRIRRAKKRRMFRDVLTESAIGSLDLFRSLRRQGANSVPPNQDIWALKDASFGIRAGELIGIIGINGSGKSTLLKLLSRITAPTAGRFKIKGRVGSLLEVGTGFHSELTGRENVYLNGAILGMKRWEIDRKFDEIVAFSEIGEYLDTPAKFYSSGMRMRLAFSVAAHLEPEILLIDEVLAVGDVAFQRKSLNKMNDVVRQGRTVLFVSHNMPAIRAMCQRTILLDKGQIVTDGSTDPVIRHYLDLNEGRVGSPSYTSEETARGSGVVSATVLDSDRTPSSYLAHDKPAFVRLELQLMGGHSHVYITMRLYNQDQETVLASYDFDADKAYLQEREPGRYTYHIELPGNLLAPGLYTLGFEVARLSKKLGTSPRKELHRIDHVCGFEVYDGGSAMSRLGLPWEGVLHPPIGWELIAGPARPREKQADGL